MKLYLAGPMTGIPQFNFPAFDEAASNLRMVLGGDGVDVVSPAEIDDPATRAAALASKDGAPGSGTTSGETWGDFLSRDVKLVADEVDAVMVLPGWENSKGARLEVFVARSVGKPVYDYDRWSKYDGPDGEAHKFDPVEEFDRWLAGCRVEGLPVFELNDLYLASVIGNHTFDADINLARLRQDAEEQVESLSDVEQNLFRDFNALRDFNAQLAREIIHGPASPREEFEEMADAALIDLKEAVEGGSTAPYAHDEDAARLRHGAKLWDSFIHGHTHQTKEPRWFSGPEVVEGLNVERVPILDRIADVLDDFRLATAREPGETRLGSVAWSELRDELRTRGLDGTPPREVRTIEDGTVVYPTTVFGIPVRVDTSVPHGSIRVDGDKPLVDWMTPEQMRTEDVLPPSPDDRDEYGATRVTSETGGQKGQKGQRMGLIPPEFLLALSEVYGMGAKKYDDHNYLKGYDWSLSIDALLRHLMVFQSGEDTDPESGLPHILHVAWHCATLFMFDEHGLGTDDRLFHTIEKNAADRDAKEAAGEFFRRDRPDVDLLG